MGRDGGRGGGHLVDGHAVAVGAGGGVPGEEGGGAGAEGELEVDALEPVPWGVAWLAALVRREAHCRGRAAHEEVDFEVAARVGAFTFEAWVGAWDM